VGWFAALDGLGFDNQRPRQALEHSIRRPMEFQSKAGIALAGFNRVNGEFVVRTVLDPTDEADVYETGYWASREYPAREWRRRQPTPRSVTFGHLGAKARMHFVT
jgi:hypothetical protein